MSEIATVATQDANDWARAMQLSYVTPTSTTLQNASLAQYNATANDLKTYANLTYYTQADPRQKPTKEDGMAKARLIRYTVVDPDPILAEHLPERCILTAGTVVLNGMDDRGFVMDLAPKVQHFLEDHNLMRETVEYEDSEGRTKKLKAIRLGQLDVVVELVKQYQ